MPISLTDIKDVEQMVKRNASIKRQEKGRGGNDIPTYGERGAWGKVQREYQKAYGVGGEVVLNMLNKLRNCYHGPTCSLSQCC